MNDASNPLAGINWLVSIAGAIILSILANLLTYPIRNRLANISVKRSEKRIAQLKLQLSQIESFVNTPSTLYMYILTLMLRAVLTTLIAFAISDMTFASINASLGIIRFPGRHSELFYAVSQFVTSLFYLIAINHTFRALRTVRRVHKFPEYKAEIEKVITSLNKSDTNTQAEQTSE